MEQVGNTNEIPEKSDSNLKSFFKKRKKLLLVSAALFLIATVILGGLYYYNNYLNKKTVRTYPEIQVKNNGWDPAKEEDKARLDSYKLSLTDGSMLKAKLKMKELSEINLSGIDGGNFAIYDLRFKEDYDAAHLDGAINVTPEEFLDQIDQIDLEDIVFIMSYQEDNEDIKWATRASLMQGHFSPMGVKGGYYDGK